MEEVLQQRSKLNEFIICKLFTTCARMRRLDESIISPMLPADCSGYAAQCRSMRYNKET